MFVGATYSQRHFTALHTFPVCLDLRASFEGRKAETEEESGKTVSLGFFDLEIGLVTDIF